MLLPVNYFSVSTGLYNSSAYHPNNLDFDPECVSTKIYYSTSRFVQYDTYIQQPSNFSRIIFIELNDVLVSSLKTIVNPIAPDPIYGIEPYETVLIVQIKFFDRILNNYLYNIKPYYFDNLLLLSSTQIPPLNMDYFYPENSNNEYSPMSTCVVNRYGYVVLSCQRRNLFMSEDISCDSGIEKGMVTFRFNFRYKNWEINFNKYSIIFDDTTNNTSRQLSSIVIKDGIILTTYNITQTIGESNNLSVSHEVLSLSLDSSNGVTPCHSNDNQWITTTETLCTYSPEKWIFMNTIKSFSACIIKRNSTSGYDFFIGNNLFLNNNGQPGIVIFWNGNIIPMRIIQIIKQLISVLEILNIGSGLIRPDPLEDDDDYN